MSVFGYLMYNKALTTQNVSELNLTAKCKMHVEFRVPSVIVIYQNILQDNQY